MRNLHKRNNRFYILGGLSILTVLLLSLLPHRSTAAARQSVETPTPTPLPTANAMGPSVINPALFAEQQTNAAISLLPDLVITELTSSQAGYQAGDTWQVTTVVTNIGGTTAGHFFVSVSIGRFLDGGEFLDFEPLPPLVIDEVTSLDPGASATLTSPPFDFSYLVPDTLPTSYTSWLEGYPDRGLIYLLATADLAEYIGPAGNAALGGEVEEHNESNNTSLTTFLYPNAPQGAIYDPAQDEDGDGFYPPEDCHDMNPFVHPLAEEIQGDGLDNDCTGGEWGSGPIPGWRPLEGDAGLLTEWGAYDMDQDGDGFSQNQGDCNEYDASIFPGQTEADNGLDDDCDRLVDEGFDFPDPDDEDFDADGWTVGEGDCNDLIGAINPGTAEYLDGVDNDCDGYTDEYLVTPDWVIPEFSLTRWDGPNCEYDSELCGVWFQYQVANVGGDLGTQGLADARNSVRIVDLSGQEFAPDHDNMNGFIPYSEFPTPAYAESMACAPSGMLAVLPGGLLDEENTSNNWAAAYLPSIEANADVDVGTVIADFDRAARRLEITLYDTADIACPPLHMLEYYNQGTLFVDGEQIVQSERLRNAGDSAAISMTSHYIYDFDPRPHNGAAIRLEFLVNSQNDPNEVDRSNNLCVLEFTYDRASLDPLGVFNNDRLIFENSQGCEFMQSGIEGPAQVGQALGGSSGSFGQLLGMGVIITTMALGGAGLSGFLASRVGASGVGFVITTLTGAALGGVLGLGVAAGYVAMVNFSPATQLQVETENVVVAETAPDSLVGWLSASDEYQATYCDAYFKTSASMSTSPSGELSVILIHIQVPSNVTLPPHTRFRITIWDRAGIPHEIVTEQTTLSLVSVGLNPANFGIPILWQVVAEALAGVGGDLYLPLCLPDRVHSQVVPSEELQSIAETGPLFHCDSIRGVSILENGQLLVNIGCPEVVDGEYTATVEAPDAIGYLCKTDAAYPGRLFCTGDLTNPGSQAVIRVLDGDFEIIFEGQFLVPFKPTPEPTFAPPPVVEDPASEDAPPPTPGPETDPPKVSGPAASPNPALTTTPVTITAAVNDLSGVASVTLYYRVGKGAYQSAGTMKLGGGNSYSLNIGALSAGSYTFRIVAVDSLGNATCDTSNLDACPGSGFDVNIP